MLVAGCHKSRRGARNEVMRQADQSDEELLRRHAAGDTGAFVAYYRRNVSMIVAFLMRRTRDAELTADLTAEVFAAALLSAPSFQPAATPARAWLYGIAAHKLADSRRRGRVEDQARRLLGLEPLTVDDLDLERVEELASQPTTERLEDAIAALPVEQRDAVLARVVQERPYGEIAAEMQCSEMLVRQRVSRGLKTLRSKIKESR
jgi:RNA polymerase sigma factor (sigma-70 family)